MEDGGSFLRVLVLALPLRRGFSFSFSFSLSFLELSFVVVLGTIVLVELVEVLLLEEELPVTKVLLVTLLGTGIAEILVLLFSPPLSLGFHSSSSSSSLSLSTFFLLLPPKPTTVLSTLRLLFPPPTTFFPRPSSSFSNSSKDNPVIAFEAFSLVVVVDEEEVEIEIVNDPGGWGVGGIWGCV